MTEQRPDEPYRGDGANAGRPASPKNGFGTASLVLGILSLLLFIVGPLAFLLGLVAVVLGVLGRGRVKNGIATNGGAALAGIICGALGLLLGAVITVTAGAFFVEFGDDIRDTVDCAEQNAGDQAAIDRCLEDLQRGVEQQQQ